MNVEVVLQDITTLKVDAIVNAANRSLLGGGGVDGAIHRAAGEKLYKACKKLGGCNTGDAKITKGYDLPARYIIHTVGPVWQGGGGGEDIALKNCYLSSLQLAVLNGVKTIAFPAISCGVYRFPPERAALIAVGTVLGFLKRNDDIERVTFAFVDEKLCEIYKDVLADYGKNIESVKASRVFNPFLPSWEYIPDGEPHVFGDRVYLYGSHDKFGGISFCLNDYVCWSAPVNDLSRWRKEGVIFTKKQDPKHGIGFLNSLYAPDVCRGNDGRYYLYYFIGFTSRIGVAVCSEPAGRYEFLDYVRYEDGTLLGKKGEPLQFDPGVINDDGKIYLYTGFGAVKCPKFVLGGKTPTSNGAMGFRLKDDMTTIDGEMHYIGVPSVGAAKGTPYEGHEFFEASSMRRFGGKYYFIYSSYLSHELCYATSDDPLCGFEYKGTLISNGDIGVGEHKDPKSASDFTGNTHGSVEKINGEYYVFYHRHTNRHQFSRQACAERLTMKENGEFERAERTSSGMGESLGLGEYEARIACNLSGKNGARFYGVFRTKKRKEPYFTQSGEDRECDPDQYIAGVSDGTEIGFKYFECSPRARVSVKLRGSAKGKMLIFANGQEVGEIAVEAGKEYEDFFAEAEFPREKFALRFKFVGRGKADFKSFELQGLKD